MTNPIHTKPNISLDYILSVPHSVKKPIPNIPTDSLRLTQSAQEGFSLQSIWNAIVGCFKAVFSCFFTTSLSPKDEIAQIAARDQFLWFYKKEENPLTAFLGNFHPCPIQLWGLQFQCAEGAFQAAKFHPNINLVQQFQNLDGEAAFRLGRSLSHMQIANWQQRNLGAMREVVTAKFTQNADLKELLLATGSAYLVEHIPVRGRDAFWGDNHDGTGQNWLGRIAMEVRGSLGGAREVPRNSQYNQFITRI
jgi:N-glycosidase YbiA